MAGFADRIWTRFRTWPTWLQVVLWLGFPYILALVLIWRTDWSQRPKWIATGVVIAGSVVLLVAVSIEDEAPLSAPSVESADSDYSEIVLTSVEYDPPAVVIEGTTDLPAGAVLNVEFNVPTKPDDPYIGVDQEVTVTGGSFSASLEPPQRAEFESGPYVVEVLFTPKGQPSDVIEAVGADGERLTGPLLEESFGFNLLSVRERPELTLDINPPTYAFEKASAFELDSPEWAVAVFADAWKERDWRSMVGATQITWAQTEQDPQRSLRNWYGIKKLLGFEVLRSKRNSTVSVDVTFKVWYEAITNNVESHEITGRVLRESAPYELDPRGTWGVNPLSTLREH